MKSNYQVFISFKNSNDQTEEETPDKAVAYKVYKYLSSRGLNVFFSPVTLKALGRDSWEDEINLALKESKVFIALGTSQENMNAHYVKKERDFFGGLKLVDESRAMYGYIASPMRLKDVPDDISKKEVFQDKNSNALVELYTYIRNHLARDFREEFNNEPKSNNSYLWIGLLLFVGVIFFNMTNHDDGLVKIVEKEIAKKEGVIKEQKKEIEEKVEENKKDKLIILTQAKKLEIVNQAIIELEKEYPDIAHKLKNKLKLEGVEVAYNYFIGIDWGSYSGKIKDGNDLNNTKDFDKIENNMTITDSSLYENVIINTEIDSSYKSRFEEFDSISLIFEKRNGRHIYFRKKRTYKYYKLYITKHITLSIKIGEALLMNQNQERLIKRIYMKLYKKTHLNISKNAIYSILKYLKSKSVGSSIVIWNDTKNKKYKNRLTLHLENLSDLEKIEEKIRIFLIDSKGQKMRKQYTIITNTTNDEDMVIDINEIFQELSYLYGENIIEIQTKDDSLLLITPSIDKVFICPLIK